MRGGRVRSRECDKTPDLCDERDRKPPSPSLPGGGPPEGKRLEVQEGGTDGEPGLPDVLGVWATTHTVFPITEIIEHGRQ